MGDEINLPRELAEAVAELRFPSLMDQRLQDLMDRNNDGALSQDERKELESLAHMSHAIALVRAKALRYLGRQPR